MSRWRPALLDLVCLPWSLEIEYMAPARRQAFTALPARAGERISLRADTTCAEQ